MFFKKYQVVYAATLTTVKKAVLDSITTVAGHIMNSTPDSISSALDPLLMTVSLHNKWKMINKLTKIGTCSFQVHEN
jgi:hypothetical protein